MLATHDGPDGPVLVPRRAEGCRGRSGASVAVDVDPDAILRRMIHIPVETPTFAVRGAETFTGEKVPESKFPDNHAWIDFAGPPGTYPDYSFVEVLTASRAVPDTAHRGGTCRALPGLRSGLGDLAGRTLPAT